MSNVASPGNEVVFVPEQFEAVPGFFRIPSNPEYLASREGRIWYIRAGREIAPREHKTSIGSYLAISVRVGLKFEHALVHLLVAEAFHGPPVGERNFVNHKDGNKHNNKWDNLEWVTRSENLIHAYKTGLRSDKRAILCVDHESGDVREFYSMSQVGREFGWLKHQIWKNLRDHQIARYLDRYTFMFPTEETTIRQRTSKEEGGVTRVIVAKHYLTNKCIVAPDQGTAELLTGVKRGTINFTLQLAKKPYQLVNGWVFKYLEDPAEFPEYSQAYAQASLLSSGAGSPVQVTDRETNTTSTHASIAALAKSLGEHPNTIRRSLLRTPGVFRNFDIVEVV